MYFLINIFFELSLFFFLFCYNHTVFDVCCELIYFCLGSENSCQSIWSTCLSIQSNVFQYAGWEILWSSLRYMHWLLIYQVCLRHPSHSGLRVVHPNFCNSLSWNHSFQLMKFEMWCIPCASVYLCRICTAKFLSSYHYNNFSQPYRYQPFRLARSPFRGYGGTIS